MRKYSVFDLFVVRVKNEDENLYFICKFYSQNIYKEIFTNKKICVDGESYVERLSDYYPPIAICTYGRDGEESSNHLMLSKKDLLYKYISINKIELTDKLNQEKILNEDVILENAIKDFFPKDGVWYSDCFKRPKELTMRNLPCHLRNNNWLTQLLIKEKNLSINYHKVLNFIKNSNKFQEERHKYEQEIVKWQINWMIHDGENWICDDDFWLISPSCDLIFRKGVVDTLKAIGMDINAIEEGIEKNANLWRDFLIKRAFENKYEPIILNFEYKKDETVNSEYKENWIKMRKYEYYKTNKNSVDKYGVVEEDMTMSNEEALKLKSYLEYEQYKNENYEKGYEKLLK